MGSTETPDERRWRSMSDLHIDITERLEAGETPSSIAAEFGVDIDIVDGVVGDVAPEREELTGLVLLDARGEVVRTEVTTAPFERSHGRSPKGYGAWAFQATTHRTGYASELTGEVEFFSGTFTEAAVAAQRFFKVPLIAVLG